MKPFTKLAAEFFGLAALLHLIRLFYPFRIMIGRNMIPYSVSFVAIGIVYWTLERVAQVKGLSPTVELLPKIELLPDIYWFGLC